MTADPAARNATCHIDIAGDGSISGLTVDLDGQINQRILSVCPLTDVLLQIPFTDRLFVSGSCATWMAERVMLQCDPEWLPNDIDVFACLPLDDFDIMVAQFMRLQRDADAISVVHKRHNRIEAANDSGCCSEHLESKHECYQSQMECQISAVSAAKISSSSMQVYCSRLLFRVTDISIIVKH